MSKKIIKQITKVVALSLILGLFSTNAIIASAYTKGIRIKNAQDAAEYSQASSYIPVPVQTSERKQSLIQCTKLLDKNEGTTISTRFGTITRLENNTWRAWVAMQKVAYYDGIDISISFAYRSLADQQRLYDNYIKDPAHNPAAAKPPGAHQTGRAIDIFLGEENIEKMTPAAQQALPAYKWLYDNASKFGFYGFSKSNPEFEGWHWVYNP